MKKRYPAAIGAGGLLVYAAFQFLPTAPGLNLGTVPSSGPGETEPEAQRFDAGPTMVTTDPFAEATADPTSQGAVEEAPRLGAVDVLIDGEQYLVRSREDQPRQPLPVAAIIAAADAAAGEPSGIRIRVSRTEDAVAASELNLMEMLGEHFNDDQIDRRTQLVTQ